MPSPGSDDAGSIPDIAGSVPDMADDPVRWDARSRSFISTRPPADPRPTMASPVADVAQPPPAARSAPRKVTIGPEHVGKAPSVAGSRAVPSRAGAPIAPAAVPPAAAAAQAVAPVEPPRIVTAPARGKPTTVANGGAPPRGTAPARTSSGGGATPRSVRRTGKRIARVVTAVVMVVVLLVVGLFAFGWWQFSRIEKVPVAEVLSSSGNGGTNYLIVGSDSRDGIDESDPNSGAFLGDHTEGQRTDSIMVLRVTGSGSTLLSIPRDLWVTNPVTGEVGRINSVYQSGPGALIEAVQGLGIPVNHYLEIDFVNFGKLVDAVGGITIDFAAPARDTHSGLDVAEAGRIHLDGEQALAYVRSRYYEQFVDGEWQVDGTADLGRVLRQRAFLQALMGEVSGARSPVTLVRIASTLGGGVKVDDAMSYFDAIGLMWHMRNGIGADSATLPVTPRTTSGGAQVLDLDQGAAGPVITAFGG